MLSMAFAWFVFSMYFADSPAPIKNESDTNGSIIKHERSDSETFDPTSYDDLSDTSRTFPTLGRQMPLHFSGRRDVFKKEEDEMKREEDEVVRSTGLQPLSAEADDEGDDVIEEMSGWRDSGIGTGIEEDRAAGVQRRKASRGGKGDDGT